jgi:hypothetical protein
MNNFGSHYRPFAFFFLPYVVSIPLRSIRIISIDLHRSFCSTDTPSLHTLICIEPLLGTTMILVAGETTRSEEPNGGQTFWDS